MTFGVEVTGVMRTYRENSSLYGETPTPRSILDHKAYSLLVRYELRSYGYDVSLEPYTDGHCIEIQSPVFSNIDELIRFNYYVFHYFRIYNILPQRRAILDGGGHLHFGGLTSLQQWRVFNLMLRHPEVTWVFTHPDDIDSCNNFTAEHYSASVLKRQQRPKYWNYLEDSKKDAVTLNNNKTTIEFRCVESPRNCEEFKHQLRFFHALVLHAIRIPAKRTKLRTYFKHQKLTRKWATHRFYSLLATLGLNPKNYAPFVRRNLTPRWGTGRQRT